MPAAVLPQMHMGEGGLLSSGRAGGAASTTTVCAGELARGTAVASVLAAMRVAAGREGGEEWQSADGLVWCVHSLQVHSRVYRNSLLYTLESDGGWAQKKPARRAALRRS